MRTYNMPIEKKTDKKTKAQEAVEKEIAFEEAKIRITIEVRNSKRGDIELELDSYQFELTTYEVVYVIQKLSLALRNKLNTELSEFNRITHNTKSKDYNPLNVQLDANLKIQQQISLFSNK